VWFEACTGYLSATVQWAKEHADDATAWERWWKDPTCRQYYFLGKDNIPFHTVIWPSLLMGRGDTILPYDVPANEYMNVGGQKASKSAGVGTTVPQLLSAFDPDHIRYYLIANAPETADTSYSGEDFVRRSNEVAGTWGNLIHRTLTFLQRSFDGAVPEHATDTEVAAALRVSRERVEGLLDEVHLRQGLMEVLALARFGNEWLDRQKPWEQLKRDRPASQHTLGSLLDLLNGLKVLFAPFLPHTSERLHGFLGYQDTLQAHGWAFEPVPAGRKLPMPTPLFRRLETARPDD
jgi:methionyl-tRNA synthetase